MKHFYNLNSNKIELVETQLSLLKILATGATLKEAAEILCISINTVKTRLRTLYIRFGVNNRADLIKQAIHSEIINFKDIKPRFRKRFIKLKNNKKKQPIILKEALTPQEFLYLNLIAHGLTQKEIITIMNLSGIYHARVLAISISYKLSSRNITEAVANAGKLGDILKMTLYTSPANSNNNNSIYATNINV